ncbi:MAG: hypothetical protein Q9207_006308 [Kuettlingeria erythrocarpa]
MLADLAEINQCCRTQRAQYLQEAREQALADYQPPPYSPTPERERSPPEGDLPTPSTTPPPVHPQPPGAQSQSPPKDKPRPATSLADLCTRKVPRSVQFRALVEKANAESGGHPVLPLNYCERLPNETPLGAIGDSPASRPFSPLQPASTNLQPPYQKPKALEPSQRRNLPAINPHDKIESLATYNIQKAGHVCSARSERGLHSKRVERLGPSCLTLLDPCSTIHQTFKFQRRQEAPGQEMGSG